MNEEYGVDFIARCIAAEALEKAEEGPSITVDDALSTTSENPVQNKVITNALNNVEIDVDDALSTTSENPVQNKVITVEVNSKPTCVNTSGTKVNGQKIMELTKAQYDAIQNKDSDTYYMITDDIASGAYTGGTGIEIENYEISIDEDVVATKTWVGNQGYLTDANQVPTVGQYDNGKILTAIYDGYDGTYGWRESRQVPNPTSGDVDKYLKATGLGSFSWQAGPTGVPSGTQSDIGKVLTYGSSGAEWATASGGNEPVMVSGTINNTYLADKTSGIYCGRIDPNLIWYPDAASAHTTENVHGIVYCQIITGDTTNGEILQQIVMEDGKYSHRHGVIQNGNIYFDSLWTKQESLALIYTADVGYGSFNASKINNATSGVWYFYLDSGIISVLPEGQTKLETYGTYNKIQIATSMETGKMAIRHGTSSSWGAWTLFELTSNKVTSLSSSSTDTEYPSAKCVYDLVGNIQTVLASLTTPVSP